MRVLQQQMRLEKKNQAVIGLLAVKEQLESEVESLQSNIGSLNRAA